MSFNGQLGSLVRASVSLGEEDAKLALEYVELLTGPDRRLWRIQLADRLREKLRDDLPLLRLLDATIKYSASGSPHGVTFYDDRPGFRVYDDAYSKFNAWAGHQFVPPATGCSYELNKRMRVSDVVTPAGRRIFSGPEVGAYMKQLLTKQSTAKPGVLVTNGYANVFLVGEEAFTVRWNHLWMVDAKQPDHQLDAGDKLFFLN